MTPFHAFVRCGFALAAASAVLTGAPAQPPPIVPTNTIQLFNGRDLSAFYTWLADYAHEDPHHVFTVVPQVDGQPAIRISGQDFGGLITRQSYARFVVTADFRWGTETWGARKKTARDSGILLYCQGEDGNSRKDFKGFWPRSVEFQVIEGGTGDLLLVGGFERATMERIAPTVRATVLPGTTIWNPAGALTEFSGMARIVRIDWRDRDPEWRNEIGFRGKKDVEKPLGQWNHLEATCDGSHLIYRVNGEKVNEVTACSFREGRLLFQSEGAEIYYRRIELRPIPAAP